MTDNKKHPIKEDEIIQLIDAAYERALDGDQRGTERLLYYLNSDVFYWYVDQVKFYIVDLLHQLKHPAGEQFIRARLSSRFREYCLSWLAQEGDKNAYSQLIESLSSKDDGERYRAGVNLLRIGDKEGLSTLFELYDGWIDTGGDVGPDIMFYFVDCLADDMDVINFLYDRVESTKIVNKNGMFEWVIEDLIEIDTEGSFTCQKLCYLLIDDNTERRQIVAEKLIKHYLDKLNISVLIEIEERFISPEIDYVIDTWASY